MTSCPNIESAHTILDYLFDEKLIACGQIDNSIKSKYIWKGNIVENEEVRIILKFKLDNSEKLSEMINEKHPYEVPEWIHWEAETTKMYSEWIRNPS